MVRLSTGMIAIGMAAFLGLSEGLVASDAEAATSSEASADHYQHGLSVGVTKGASNWGTLYTYHYNLSGSDWQLNLQSSQNRFLRRNGGGRKIVTADRSSLGMTARYVLETGLYCGAGLDGFLYDYQYENASAYGADQNLRHRSYSIDGHLDVGWQSTGPFLVQIGFRGTFGLKSPQAPDFDRITTEDGWQGAAKDTWDRNVERNFIYLGLGWYLFAQT